MVRADGQRALGVRVFALLCLRFCVFSFFGVSLEGFRFGSVICCLSNLLFRASNQQEVRIELHCSI